MKIGTPKEVFPGENRVAMTPESAGFLQKLGYECAIQSGAGKAAGYADADYERSILRSLHQIKIFRTSSV